jgi:transcriptional regulator with XRE-family HTH domain
MSLTASSAFAPVATRWRRDITQTEAARRLGVHQSYLNKIEAGIRAPSVRVLKRMKDVYGLDDAEVRTAVDILVGEFDDDESDAPAAA